MLKRTLFLSFSLSLSLYIYIYTSEVNLYEDYFRAIFIHMNRLIGVVGRVFANGPGDLGSIPGSIIPRILKMVFHTS